jgi:deoxyribose-phosphate aldolase
MADMKFTEAFIKRSLDVALLSPTATPREIEDLARVVHAEGFGQICVASLHVKRAASVLGSGPSKVVACVGFPHGTCLTETKVFEAERARKDGAGEIDMVLNLGAFLGGDFASARQDIAAVVQAAAGAPVKVIIETPYLTTAQKIAASQLVGESGAAFVKTCTGVSPDPVALYEDVRLIRRTIGSAMGLKASGRVGNYLRFVSMIEAGANRVGLMLAQAREILRGWAEEQREGNKP